VTRSAQLGNRLPRCCVKSSKLRKSLGADLDYRNSASATRDPENCQRSKKRQIAQTKHAKLLHAPVLRRQFSSRRKQPLKRRRRMLDGTSCKLISFQPLRTPHLRHGSGPWRARLSPLSQTPSPTGFLGVSHSLGCRIEMIRQIGGG
jgi:hypothetical protein